MTVFNRFSDAWIAVLIILLFLLSSCEKVIDLELNSEEKKYVIEAVLTDNVGDAEVKITRTKDFDENNFFAGVGGATVSVSEVGGTTIPFRETAVGLYQATAFKGISGKTYNLSVSIGSQQFTATSTMPQRVNLDTIFVTNELLFTDYKPVVNAVFDDPAGRGNNYRFVQYANERKGAQIPPMNDDYTDGREVTSKLFYFEDDDDDIDFIKPGDSIRVQLQCIDAAMYKYWFSLLRSSTGGSQQATPSNPVSNMRGGALGYFSAHTVQEKRMIVP